MSYLAIARKYRPATFDEMVGQEHVTRTLRNAIARSRIHHAYLFTGARGVGKTTAARALAKALNCKDGPTAEPCGACVSCREIAAGNSPDLIEIDGASNNSVDDVRDLRETVHYAPTHGRYKVYLVDEVHMLSKGAFNALLKTLEEPPPHVIFLFATTEPTKIPDTILSRVQRFDFKRIPVSAVIARLGEIATAEGATVSPSGLRLIAHAGEGSMRDAQSLLDQVIAAAGPEVTDAEIVECLGLVDRGLLYEMLGGLLAGEPDRCLEVVARVHDYGHELGVFTAEMLEVLRNATFCRLSAGARRHLDVAEDELQRLDDLTRDVEPERLTRAFTVMLDVHDQVTRAPRPRTVLEMAVARLATTRPVQPVSELLGRLDDLERRLRQSGATPPSAPRGRQTRPERRPDAATDDDRPRPAPPAPPAPQPQTAQQLPPALRDLPPTPPVDTYARAVAPPLAASGDPWSALVAGLARLGPETAPMSGGKPHFDGRTLRIEVASGLQVAKARRVHHRPDVQNLLATVYSDAVHVEFVVERASTTDEDRQRERTDALLRDPAARRIVDTLGARVDHVRDASEGE